MMRNRRSLILRYIAANVAISASVLARDENRVFELDNAGRWQDRGKLRGKQAKDTWWHIKRGHEIETVCCPESSEADPHIQALIDYICKDGVPDQFKIRLAGRRTFCTFASWVRDIVDALARKVSVEEIMAILSDHGDIYSCLGVETAHEKIEAHAEIGRLIANIAQAIHGSSLAQAAPRQLNLATCARPETTRDEGPIL